MVKQTNNMETYIALGVIFLILIIVVWKWVDGIDYMHKNHPDYKGDDLFGDFTDEDKDHLI